MIAFPVVPLVLAALAAPQDPPLAAPPVPVFGRVVDRESGAALAGARVDALLDGAFPAGRARTDDRGEFGLVLPAGVYDLRALCGDGVHRAAFARDVDLVAEPGTEVRIEVVTVAEALWRLGLEPEWLADLDRDLVPDETERRSGLDPEVTDRNEADVRAGVAGWVGADPAGGVPRTDAAPVFLRPAPDAVHPVIAGGPTLPLGLVFAAVPGATGYVLEVLDRAGDAVARTSLEFARDHLLVGEGVVASWTPQRGMPAGWYRLRLQGYHHHAEDTVGLPAEVAVELVRHEPGEVVDVEIVPGEGAAWEGLVVVRSLTLRTGAEVRVPAGRTLELFALGDVVLERGARLVGADGTSGRDGEPPLPAASVALSIAGALESRGEVRAGRGHDASAVEVAGSDGHTVARAEPGGAGGALHVFATGPVHVARDARLASGRGGGGGAATARASAPGADAVAHGGDGGPGGPLVLWCSRPYVADRPGAIAVGEGGAGGDAAAFGGPGGASEASGLGTALPGVGGAAGDVWLSRWDLRGDGFLHVGDRAFPVAGGRAGAAGAGQVAPGAPAPDVAGRAHRPPAGRAGRRGWREGGPGQPIVARGSGGGTGRRGGDAEATGGPGGPASRIGLRASELERVLGFLPRGGGGGVAVAQGGEAGPPAAGVGPGDGGAAEATGGTGGPGLLFPSPCPSEGGVGGRAIATGADGLPGADRCSPPDRGGKGSGGGDASATGGRGGDAYFLAGTPGESRARGGDGGRGGNGIPPGPGGYGGSARIGAEPTAAGALPARRPSGADPRRGARGASGQDCPRGR